jgi:hypothetical protein
MIFFNFIFFIFFLFQFHLFHVYPFHFHLLILNNFPVFLYNLFIHTYTYIYLSTSSIYMRILIVCIIAKLTAMVFPFITSTTVMKKMRI